MALGKQSNPIAKKNTSVRGASDKSSARKRRPKASRVSVTLRQRPSVAMMATPQPLPASPHFPGFDTGSYPGDKVLQKWFGDPYVFTGYYLEAPCHNSSKFKAWSGHLATSKQIGWGLVVVYVGRQASGCGSNVLTRAQGTTDATDAINKAKGDGVAVGATVFLDVELMDTLSAKMVDYMRGWLAGILQDQSFKPGLYAHFRNATDLFNAAQQEYAALGQPGGAPVFWVVRAPGGNKFDVNTSSPQDLNNLSPKPISFASVWQGRIDIKSETHGGVTFGPVDQNVAHTKNPSNA